MPNGMMKGLASVISLMLVMGGGMWEVKEERLFANGQVYPGDNPYIGPATLSRPNQVLVSLGQYGYPHLNWGQNEAAVEACPQVEHIYMFNISCDVYSFLDVGFFWANSSDPVVSAKGYSLLDTVFAFLQSGVAVAPISDVWGYDDPQFGNAYALVGAGNGLSIIDVTIPQSPRSVGFFYGSYSVWRDIKTRGNYAYYVQDNTNYVCEDTSNVNSSYCDLLTPTDGLSIVDLSRADSPRLVKHDLSEFSFAHNLFVEVEAERPFAYVCGGDITSVGGIGIFNLTDPENPVLIHRWDQVYIHDVMVQKRGQQYLLYGAAIFQPTGQESLYIFDVTNPAAPRQVAAPVSKYPWLHNVWPTEDSRYLYCSHEDHGAPISIWDASDLSNVKEVAALFLTEDNDDISAHNVFVRGNRLFVSYYSMGTVVYDISQPVKPVMIGRYDTYPQNWQMDGGYEGNWGVYPFAAARPELDAYYIYSSDVTNGLFILGFKPVLTGQPGPDADSSHMTPFIIVSFTFLGLLSLCFAYLLFLQLTTESTESSYERFDSE